MKKLTNQSELNSPSSYDKIFLERQKKGVDEHDARRWRRLLKYYKGGKLFDGGCLDSEIPEIMMEYLLDGVGEYHGIDIAEESINTRSLVWRNIQGAYFSVSNVYDTKFDDSLFEYAVLGEVLEHLEKPDYAIKEAMRILKPGGVLAISVPLDEAREPGAVDGHRHIWSFDEKDMHALLGGYGKVETHVPMRFFRNLFLKPPFYRYCWPSLISFCWKT